MASAPANNNEIAFSFTGKTGEYFGIWIVNVLLIIITLGIYTAWAKVRTKRYFYGHTLLNNSPFDYWCYCLYRLFSFYKTLSHL